MHVSGGFSICSHVGLFQFCLIVKKKQKQKQKQNQNIGDKQARNKVTTQGLKFQYTKRHV